MSSCHVHADEGDPHVAHKATIFIMFTGNVMINMNEGKGLYACAGLVSLFVAVFSITMLTSCSGDDPMKPPVTQVQIVDIIPPAEFAPMEQWFSAGGATLKFIINNEVRTPDGFFFEGRNQGTVYEELTGRVEIIKEGGWMRMGATFSYESEYGDFVESIFGPFAGIALDIYEPMSADPYIAFPANEGVSWTSDTVFVSDGTTEYLNFYRYRIEYVGDVDLMADGQAKGFSDVIHYIGEANATLSGNRPDLVEAYLAPDYGIIFALFRLFDVENACALIGYGGENVLFPGEDAIVKIIDYFPTAPGNQWLYEFSNDSEEGEEVNFRFSVVER